MGLRNENIGIGVALVVVGVGMLLTNGDPGQVEAAVIGVLALAAVFGLSLYLNERGDVYRRSLRR
jgi:drug/metabolite transporter (DMT)-like permease